MNSKDLYRQLCASEMSIPIFSMDWWLDAVCGSENWQAVIIEKNGNVVGAMPYYYVKKCLFNIIEMPTLTQVMGPWIKYPENQKYANKVSWEKEVYSEMIRKLPLYDSFHQNFHYSVTNWLPFYWRGFQQTTRYTYIIENLQNSPEIFLQFKDNMRNKIRKAEKTVSVIETDQIEIFYQLNKKTFSRQGIEMPYSFEFVMNLNNILKEKNSRKIFLAIDKHGYVHSALYLIWDNLSSYVHMVGEDPELRKSGAGILLIYESIKFTKEVLELDCYDFEGSMIEPIEKVRRACGGVQKPYFSITKTNSRLLKLIQSFNMFWQVIR